MYSHKEMEINLGFLKLRNFPSLDKVIFRIFKSYVAKISIPILEKGFRIHFYSWLYALPV